MNGGASGRGFGIATSKGSGLRDPINMAVLRLRESGKLGMFGVPSLYFLVGVIFHWLMIDFFLIYSFFFLAQLKQKWWNQNSQCGTVVEDGPTISYQSELSLSDLSGIFFILVLGLIGRYSKLFALLSFELFKNKFF